MGKFYLATVQAILLYGAESWALTRNNLRKLNSFHLRAIRHMTGHHIRKKSDGGWEYPEHEVLLTKCGLESIETYIVCRRETLKSYIENNKRDLLETARRTNVPARNSSKILWWNQ